MGWSLVYKIYILLKAPFPLVRRSAWKFTDRAHVCIRLFLGSYGKCLQSSGAAATKKRPCHLPPICNPSYVGLEYFFFFSTTQWVYNYI